MSDSNKETPTLNTEEGPEFKVIIEDESIDISDNPDGDEDLLSALTPSLNEADVPVPSGYPVLELRHVSIPAQVKNSLDLLLDDVDLAFRIRRTHYVQLHSPEQLSAMVAVMSGLMAPQEGSVLYRGTNIRQIEAWDYRGHQLGVIFAHDALRTNLSAIDNLIYTMDASGRTFLKPKDVLAHELLAEVNFPERLEHKPVHELTRLDYMRAALARAVCCEGDVLLAQEPMIGLKTQEQETIFNLLTKAAKRHDCAVIVASCQEPQENPYNQVYLID